MKITSVEIKPKYTLIFALLILLVSYSLWEARFLILGPRIWISTPQNGETLGESLLTMTGRAKNVAWITLNDHQIFTDEKGNWSEELIVSSGISIITVKARDRFGRETAKSVEIFLK
ncbi:MAG: hypothetical protein COV96_02340 [Candidatus Zambryskibacteria bacterium CG11_big_fil_rev_8_21_14_0_20_42_18]|uniref:Bacterial Ig domain-containing protein n=1 Tax=Candidatus Zambryskibacteria bacterium CG_4_9_14_3_um_filter_42_15 TaxID=1975112 RepID=A0A2M7WSQ9_9BACT|nr:MAG: hypothetical protein COV96_02340 [Candidatus Zambryskibacteria bacterium CG11_big_fil_rev_8_21_14_0_20_42_18]PJA33047.1 MAG: hypothetical protein CO185_00730 [Candidatus Zambryskibacteria bacterium CG_4_9_14_3_um_filter_42_15]